VVRDAGSRARILNLNIVDNQVPLIVATKIMITIKIRLIVQPYCEPWWAEYVIPGKSSLFIGHHWSVFLINTPCTIPQHVKKAIPYCWLVSYSVKPTSMESEGLLLTFQLYILPLK